MPAEAEVFYFQCELMLQLLEECVSLVGGMKVPLTPQYQDRVRNCYLLLTAACLQLTDQPDNRQLDSGTGKYYFLSFLDRKDFVC